MKIIRTELLQRMVQPRRTSTTRNCEAGT